MEKRKIAICGGIGSGKSTLSLFLKDDGFPVFSCDEINGELLKSAEYLSILKENFPFAFSNGVFDKKKLSDFAFSSDENLQKLNAISHPIIMKKLLQKMDEENSETVFAEVPLLFEGKFENLFDTVFVVLRSRFERIASVMARDNLSEGEVSARIEKQFPYPEFSRFEFFRNGGYIEDGKIVYFLNSDLDELKNSLQKYLSVKHIL